jgi:hypothetical protein
VSSYEFLEFVYEYVPFDVNSEIEEKVLFDLSMKIVSSEDTHQYFSAQKLEKVTFNKVCQYLEYIRKDKRDEIK